MANIDTRKARLYFSDGQVDHYDDQQLAFAIWLALPEGVYAAFRGANDASPVYAWDCVDLPPGRRKEMSG